MKKLGIFAVLLIIPGFAFTNVKAEKPVKIEVTLPGQVYLDCMGQWLTGDLLCEITLSKNHTLVKESGTMTGEDGTEYSVEAIETGQNWPPEWEDWGIKAINDTWIQNILVRLDGKLIATGHLVSHFTVNANGEYTVTIDDFKAHCK
jgi:hypothetical protein